MSDADLLVELFRTALVAVQAGPAVERSLSLDPLEGEVTVLAVGKAACSMAEGALRVPARVRQGLVVTKEGHGRPVGDLVVREAAHPVPDTRSVQAAEQAVMLAEQLGRGDTLLVLISGGASALWSAPAAGIDLGAKIRVTESLLGAGVDIAGLNTVRKHLSRIKGGQLALHAWPARVRTLLVSDVRGDRVDTIGSGPTAADPTTFADALEVLKRAGVTPPSEVSDHLKLGASGGCPETPKPGLAVLESVQHSVVATLTDALRTAEEAAQKRGLRVLPLGDCLYGDVGDEARALARRTREARADGIDLLVAGGEPSVRVRGQGKGGRAQQLAIAFALEVRGEPLTALFAGTDGTDGPTDAAGALVRPDTVERALAAGLDPERALHENDPYPLLDRIGGLLRTGPTDTNVSDIALIRIRD
ncbi:MAG: DUF4147 domain-containing protein [Myxococcota bacterium]